MILLARAILTSALARKETRGEGGRLYYLDGNRRVYFMEDKYGERGNQISESGLVNGYHLHKATDRKCLPDGNNRLVLKKGLELARVQYDGCAAVCKSSEGNN